LILKLHANNLKAGIGELIDGHFQFIAYRHPPSSCRETNDQGEGNSMISGF